MSTLRRLASDFAAAKTAMMRRTPLRARPRDRKDPTAPKCRRCRQSPPAVRFPPLRRGLCLTCAPESPSNVEAKLDKPVRKRPKPGKDRVHLEAVRTKLCACYGQGCRGPVQAHHIRTAATAGTGMKPTDADTAPLCLGHHAEYHQIGRHTFAAKYNVNLQAIAQSLAAFR